MANKCVAAIAAEALAFSQELKRRPFLSIVAYDRFGRIHRGLFTCHQRGYLPACHIAQGDGNFWKGHKVIKTLSQPKTVLVFIRAYVWNIGEHPGSGFMRFLLSGVISGCPSWVWRLWLALTVRCSRFHLAFFYWYCCWQSPWKMFAKFSTSARSVLLLPT